MKTHIKLDRDKTGWVVYTEDTRHGMRTTKVALVPSRDPQMWELAEVQYQNEMAIRHHQYVFAS